MQQGDIDKIVETFSFPWTTTTATREKWENCFKEQNEKRRTVLLIERDTQLLGYGSLLYQSKYPPFKTANIPESHDLWIHSEHRKAGLGKILVSHLETLAYTEGYKCIGLGVGLYSDYGSAERLYIKCGYLPDGRGITYNYLPVVPGESYPVDDDLILWMTKSLFGDPIILRQEIHKKHPPIHSP